MLLFFHIMKALQYLKENHIIHADIKLANFLGNQDQTHWCLSDFGLAMEANSISPDGRSRTGCKGSLGYIAPEVKSLNMIYYQSDLYSWSMSILASYPVKDTDCKLHHLYRHGYHNMLFSHHPYLSKQYTKCLEGLTLEPASGDLCSIRSSFRDNPILTATQLWEQQHQVFFSHPEQSLEMTEAFYTLMMPLMITASHNQYEMRGEHDQFISYFEYILTQYQHQLDSKDKKIEI
ncbi:MAG: protein kinase, partial [Endozoicomonadaceae bacterium]|nr:protein kinase [Endozoicomonadaceae bacterium]